MSNKYIKTQSCDRLLEMIKKQHNNFYGLSIKLEVETDKKNIIEIENQMAGINSLTIRLLEQLTLAQDRLRLGIQYDFKKSVSTIDPDELLFDKEPVFSNKGKLNSNIVIKTFIPYE